MIARPLDLASRLAPPPRRLEYVFFLNVGLVAVMFGLFGSRFLVSPGLSGSFLPAAPGARDRAAPATAFVSVRASGQIFTNDGLKTLEQLRPWLESQHASSGAAFATKGVPAQLEILADAGLPTGLLAQIVSAASAAGYASTVIAARDASPGGAAR